MAFRAADLAAQMGPLFEENFSRLGVLLRWAGRRIDSRSSGEYWRAVCGEPLDLDIWVGLRAAEGARTATIYAAKASSAAPPDEFYRALSTPGTLQRKVFNSPRGLH